MKKAIILGGHGFIGHHLARRLKQNGYWVKTVDIEEYKYGDYDFCNEHCIADLRNPDYVIRAFAHETFDEVYCLACMMGGAGFVFTGNNDAQIMSDSALININIAKYLSANRFFKGKLFYSSSACVYPEYKQLDSFNPGLRESDAWPADPDSVYGLEKLFSEKLFDAFHRNYGLDIRIARFHNIYGPEGTYRGGKEKAPAAMCRKVAEPGDEIEIWGDGEQTRSFLYIDDCLDAVELLMKSDYKEPINIGSNQLISINDLAKMVIGIAGKEKKLIHVSSNALGVRGRCSDNTKVKEVLGWAPKVSLLMGLTKTYQWIKSQLK